MPVKSCDFHLVYKWLNFLTKYPVEKSFFDRIRLSIQKNYDNKILISVIWDPCDTKGQLILKCLFGTFYCPKKRTKELTLHRTPENEERCPTEISLFLGKN